MGRIRARKPRSSKRPSNVRPGAALGAEANFNLPITSTEPVENDPERRFLHASLRQKSSSGMGASGDAVQIGLMPWRLKIASCVDPRTFFLEGSLAYVRYDNNSLSRGHVLVVPRRHVASYFDMTVEEKAEIQSLLDRAQTRIAADHSPDGYNIGVNIGRAAGQNRMHVHVHLIPRYSGDVRDPSGGIRCVLSKK